MASAIDKDGAAILLLFISTLVSVLVDGAAGAEGLTSTDFLFLEASVATVAGVFSFSLSGYFSAGFVFLASVGGAYVLGLTTTTGFLSVLAAAFGTATSVLDSSVIIAVLTAG